MTEKRIRQYEVLINEDGMRLDEFLAYKIGRMSRSQANACIKSGGVSIIPFRAVKPSLKIHAGDTVVLSQKMSGDVPMYEALSLVDECNDYWVFNKPAGMAVHPAANIYHNTVTRYIETQLRCTPFIVHRLDKETSGLLIVAKTAQASGELNDIFTSRSLDKRYDAIVYNAKAKYYPGAHETIDIPLGLAGIALPRLTMGIGSLDALTDVECKEIQGDFAWLHAYIHSGRQHQIRVHLALTGTPIIGDKLYLFGENFYKSWLDREDIPAFSPSRQMLHASHLAFDWHGRTAEYHADIPEMMADVFRSQTVPSMFPTPYSQLFIQ